MRFSFSTNFIKDKVLSLSDPNFVGLRNTVVSLLKEALKQNNPDLFNEYYKNSKNKVKPFTFSYYSPNLRQTKTNEANIFQFDKPFIRIYLSSLDNGFIVNIYNALKKLKKYSFFNHPISLGSFTLINQKTITQNEINFKLLSPFVVRQIDNKKGVGYLTMYDANFEDGIYYQLKNLSKHYLKKGLDRNSFSTDLNKCKSVKVVHYRQAIDTTSGLIKIRAPKDVLSMIYDLGLGCRRSQGFGMVEVLS